MNDGGSNTSESQSHAQKSPATRYVQDFCTLIEMFQGAVIPHVVFGNLRRGPRGGVGSRLVTQFGLWT
jgi:hypothetical protein